MATLKALAEDAGRARRGPADVPAAMAAHTAVAALWAHVRPRVSADVRAELAAVLTAAEEQGGIAGAGPVD